MTRIVPSLLRDGALLGMIAAAILMALAFLSTIGHPEAALRSLAPLWVVVSWATMALMAMPVAMIALILTRTVSPRRCPSKADLIRV